MYSFLPDEILKEILSPALQIPDRSFASVDVDGPSPFAKYERSTSVYLLVSKDWLRVATPLLYNVVILRSKAQIQALAWALKSTPELGTFIKKLRIECGYNNSLSQIFQAAKNLADLCLSLEIYSQDNVSGICKGVTLIQPRRVILYDPIKHTRPFNQRVIQLVEALIGVIPTWIHLTKFVLPSWRNRDLDLSTRLKRALCCSPSLQEISCSYEDSSFIPELAKIPTIKKILLRRTTGFRLRIGTPLLPDVVRDRPELADLVTFEQDCEKDTLVRRTPESPIIPFSGLPSGWLQKCPTSVLENILLYAMGIHVAGTKCFYKSELLWCDRRTLVSVCKKFREAVRNLDRQYIVISLPGDLRQLAQLYRTQPELGCLVKWLFFPSFSYLDHDDDVLDDTSSESSDLVFILSRCPNLRRVGYDSSVWGSFLNFYFSWEEFSVLASSCGHTLLDLQIALCERRSINDLTPLSSFTNLRNLCWRSNITFNLDFMQLPKTAFCSLETLACTSRDDTFLRLMALLDLPRIHSARFPKIQECPGVTCFLKKHGPKLQYLQTALPLRINVFEACQNLKFLSVPDDLFNAYLTRSPITTVFSCSQNHPLEEIHLETIGADRKIKDFFRFLGDLDLSSFSCLRCIKISQGIWPSTEHEIRKSHWVQWAERLKMLYDVDVIDSLGRAWIPRLKAKGKRN